MIEVNVSTHIIGKILEESLNNINMKVFHVIIGNQKNLSLNMKMVALIALIVLNVMAGKNWNIILLIIKLNHVLACKIVKKV